MKRATLLAALLLLSLVSIIHVTLGEEIAQRPPVVKLDPPTSLGEARARAQLLHEVVHGTLQVMHRDFFDEENIHAIPSASLEDVFKEVSRSYGVEIKWLNVQTDDVNVDHRPESDFEKDAAKKLAAGEPFTEAIDADGYHFAGPIRLASQCLKCHLKTRNSTADRTAGLVISMPYLKPATDREQP
jgi:Protein of unknown function (DUF3365)